MFVIIAQWYAKDGKQDEVKALLTAMIPISRAEPGCRAYFMHQGADDPRKFFLYEQFDDKAAFDAHCASQPFKDVVLGQIVPMLESRVRENVHLI